MKVVICLLACVATSLALPRPFESDTQPRATTLPTRIVGGTVVTKKELPYQLGLRRSGSLICGACILNANYAITAAHCAVTGSASSFSLVAGDHSLSTADGTEQTSFVSKVIIHQGYNKETFANDIALMKLATPFNLNSADQAAKAIALPASSYEASGNGLVSGWGVTYQGGSSASDQLRKVEVPIMTDAECRKYYGSSTILDTMLCAGFVAGGKDSCQGDSGGPLAVTVNNQKVLVGIVSFGNGCAQPNWPGVYTDVAKYIGWINNNAV